MKLTADSCETAMRSDFVAPFLGATGERVRGGVCPQHAPISRTRLDQVALAPAGFNAASGTGPRSWSPPIT